MYGQSCLSIHMFLEEQVDKFWYWRLSQKQSSHFHFHLYLTILIATVHKDVPAFLCICSSYCSLNWSTTSLTLCVIWILCKGKGKAVPLEAWSGPEGSRKLRFPDFMTTAQDDGKVVSLTHRPPLSSRKYSWYSFLLEAESTPGP